MIPKISEDTVHGFLGTIEDEVLRKPIRDNKMLEEKWANIVKENTELAGFIQGMMQSIFRDNQTAKMAYYLGSVFTYELLRRQDESNELEN